MNDIGAKIKAARIRKGLTQDELGKLLGVQNSAIAKYEKGRVVNIKRSTIQKMSEILDMSPAEFIMDFEEEIKKDPVALAEKHIEILMDEEFVGLFYKYKALDAKQRKVVRNLIDSLSDTND